MKTSEVVAIIRQKNNVAHRAWMLANLNYTSNNGVFQIENATMSRYGKMICKIEENGIAFNINTGVMGFADKVDIRKVNEVLFVFFGAKLERAPHNVYRMTGGDLSIITKNGKRIRIEPNTVYHIPFEHQEVKNIINL